MYQVFIVEDHAIIRESYRDLVNAEADMVVCGEAGSAPEALEQLATLEVDLVLVDLSLPGMSGFELIKQLHAVRPDLPALIVSGHPVAQYEGLARRRGAAGYVDKMEAHEILAPTIRSVLQREAGAGW